MRKGSLKLLLSTALLALGTTVYAASPVLSTLPIVVISDLENQSSTEDWNLFVFTDAFAFADYASDADTPASALKWTFDIGAGSTGSLTINDVADITTSSDDPANPASPINTVADATFREVTLSPGLSTDPITVAFPTPSAITPTMGQAADIDGDGNDDKLVGELVVSFMVADDQNDIAEVASANTFVWTYDTDLAGASQVEDQLIDQGLPFVDLPLDLGTGTPGPGVADWFYRNWSSGGGGSALTADWLTDAVSGTQARLSAFEITGAGNASQNGSFGAAYGEWISPGDPTSLFAPGNVYAVRAAFGLDGTKQDTDQPRIGIAENTTANINQTYVVNAPSTVVGIGDSPFLPAAGSTKQYLSVVDPVDADVAQNASGGTQDLYYLFNFDFVNVIAVAVRTATMTSYEVASGDSAAYNANESVIETYGSSGNTFADWEQIPPIAPLTLIGGSTLLVDAQSVVAAAGLVTITVANQTDSSANISFAEVSNVDDGAEDLDDLEVVAGAAYRADYEIAMNGGTQPGVSGGNTLGIPSLRLRSATVIPSYSIEYAVNPRNTNIFTADDTAAILEMYWTASTQFAPGSSIGEENDQQMVFGVQDFEWTDGTATMQSLTIYLLNADDPNVDY
jgi:hypothetical protein